MLKPKNYVFDLAYDKIYVNMIIVSIVKLISLILPDSQTVFFPSGFSFMNIYDSQDSRGRG